MICIRRDPTGSMARLQCDHCRRVSSLFLAGKRISDPTLVEQWLRYHAVGMGWGTFAEAEAGQEVRRDLCRRCRRLHRQATGTGGGKS